ncbi:protein TMED8 isoform A [Alligator mississippiensis]|uniref:Protein TMED8 isoform A n=1 Tax=Alligator mississippiensis TaxID=8496 RepID=A0A151M5J3_ALLMI|nr:protein TMED8 isoform A [Alligator mississippiensis]
MVTNEITKGWENESSAQNPEPAIASLESKALPCRPQIGLPINTGSVENSRKEDDASEDQDVARPGETLADQIQPLKEQRTPTRINTMLKIAARFIRLFLKRWDIGRLAEPRSYPKEAIVQMTNYRVPQGSGDIVMIQSEHTGAVDILSAELETADLLGEQRKAQPPPLAPASTWTTCKMKEFKTKMGKEKNGRMVVRRGEVVTVRVPTHPDGKRVCWEFATDDYDIGFGVYFDWTPVTSTAITVQDSPQLEMWKGAPRAICETAMVRSCLCIGGTATVTCRQAAMIIQAKASTCSNLTTPTPFCATRSCSFMYITPAEGVEGARTADRQEVKCLEQESQILSGLCPSGMRKFGPWTRSVVPDTDH